MGTALLRFIAVLVAARLAGSIPADVAPPPALMIGISLLTVVLLCSLMVGIILVAVFVLRSIKKNRAKGNVPDPDQR